MKKRGFTLAEVLITLGIIGVVAALTTPALINNSGQAKIGPSLAKFVNTMEVAAEQYMADEGISRFENGNEAFELMNHIVMAPLDSSVVYTYSDAKGGNSKSIRTMPGAAEFTNAINGYNNAADRTAYVSEHEQFDYDNDGDIDNDDWTLKQGESGDGDAFVFMQKDGTIIALIPMTIPAGQRGVGEPKGTFDGAVAEIIFDIDGDKGSGSNKASKDVFAFFLDATGAMIPYGSDIDKDMGISAAGAGILPKFASADASAGTEATTCHQNNKLADNFACTGDVADNNWKANY